MPGAFRYDAIQLYDLGFGPRLVSVTPPDCDISPSSTLHPKHRGKAPGKLTPSGWTGVDVNNPKFYCLDYATAKTWGEVWGANVGFVVGDGYVVIDNDQGEEFSVVIASVLANPLRRYVLDSKHKRDAFFLRVVDFVGDPVAVANREMTFRNGVRVAKLSILARGKQAVISGVHPGTRAPYAWSRELEGLDQIPIIESGRFDETIRILVLELAKLGWSLGGVSAPVSAPPVGGNPGGHPSNINPTDRSAFDEARALLAQIPNRDIGPNITRTNVDDWLDDYVNWVSVAYALIAFLGSLANTAEALAIWVDWSDGRPQTQSSESVWRSALSQPLRFGPIGLIKLVRSLVPATGQDFPELDLSDPVLNTKTPVWDNFRSEWALCTMKGFANMTTPIILSRQAFSDKYAYLARALCRELRPGHRGKIPSVAELFLEQPDRREVLDITYAPGEPRFIKSNIPNVPFFNFWRPTTYGALPVSSTEVKPWLDHVELMMGSAAERDRFLRWCAFVAQCPELKPNWHFLIMSLQGVGKDTLVQPIKLAVGDDNWKETLIFKLAGEFNGVVETKFLIVGETRQSDYGFASAHDVGTRLKELLARPPEMLTINKKHLHPYEIPNRVALILFSNEENPLYLERGQRRVHVVNRRDAKVEPPGYYQKLWRWLEQGGAELAASYILHYALTDAEKQEFVGGIAPPSDAKAELEHLNIHPALAALEELLADAVDTTDVDGVEGKGTGKGPFACLVATQGEIADCLGATVKNKPSAQLVRTWLLDMERRKTGVRRLRIDLKAPQRAGVVTDGKYSGRLWLLGEKAPSGRPWSSMTNVEIIAMWRNLPAPPNTKVIRHPAARKPNGGDYPADEEPV